MKCKKCEKKAVIKLRAYNISLCALHFQEFFERRVSETIKRYKLISFEDKILVAVSGGKDSLNTWFLLKKLGYRADGFHIDLGINEYSEKSREKTEKFAQKIKGNLRIVELKGELGFPLPYLAKKEGRKACAICGLIKRYLMNREALKGGYSAIATGHNLDDESAVLLSNLLNWKIGYLQRQSPSLPSWHPKLAKKIKPLCEVTERESAAYAVLNQVNYIYEDCPFSIGATTIFLKDILNQIERRSPGTKIRFYREFQQKGKGFFITEEESSLSECPICGMPTTHPPCAFCRLKNRLQKQES
jgi:uncharacterized protein (TIGR00269 family)